MRQYTGLDEPVQIVLTYVLRATGAGRAVSNLPALPPQPHAPP